VSNQNLLEFIKVSTQLDEPRPLDVSKYKKAYRYKYKTKLKY